VWDQEIPSWEDIKIMFYILTVKAFGATTEEKVGKHFAE
jgi:hypothetical protein